MTIISVIASAVLAGFVAAAPESRPAERPIVAVVLGKPVYLDDIQPSQKDCDARRQEMKADQYEGWVKSEPGHRLLGRVGRSLREEYIQREHLQATAEEIAEFKRAMQKPLKAAATRPANHAVGDRVAKESIEWWKFNKSLHAKYGGRVVWQQAGIEALDAEKRYIEDAEKAAEFKVLRADLRQPFYAYFSMKHTTVKALNPFERPWWLEPPHRPEPIRFGNRNVPPEPLATESRPH